jgi:hypothetical protein
VICPAFCDRRATEQLLQAAYCYIGLRHRVLSSLSQPTRVLRILDTIAGSLFGILQRIAELDATVARPGYRLSAARAGGAAAGKLLAPDGANGGTGIDLLRAGVPPARAGSRPTARHERQLSANPRKEWSRRRVSRGYTAGVVAANCKLFDLNGLSSGGKAYWRCR